MPTSPKTKTSTPTRLVKEFTDYAGDTLTDYLSLLARDIEDSMLQCGAVPGKDYTILDVFQLAVQFAAKNKKAK